MSPVEFYDCACPWCGEPCVLRIDIAEGSHTRVEDCEVCCRPILVRIDLDLDSDRPLQVDCVCDD